MGIEVKFGATSNLVSQINFTVKTSSVSLHVFAQTLYNGFPNLTMAPGYYGYINIKLKEEI